MQRHYRLSPSIEGSHGRNSLSDLPCGFSNVRLELPQVVNHCLAAYVVGWDNSADCLRSKFGIVDTVLLHDLDCLLEQHSPLAARVCQTPHMSSQRPQLPGSGSNKPRVSERRHDLTIGGIAGGLGRILCTASAYSQRGERWSLRQLAGLRLSYWF
jgi:hypothetical protein